MCLRGLNGSSKNHVKSISFTLTTDAEACVYRHSRKVSLLY